MNHISARYYKAADMWQTPSGKQATEREAELLNEIQMLRWELETVTAKLATLTHRADL